MNQNEKSDGEERNVVKDKKEDFQYLCIGPERSLASCLQDIKRKRFLKTHQKPTKKNVLNHLTALCFYRNSNGSGICI